MVKEIKEQSVIVQNEKKDLVEIPFGVLVWAAVSSVLLGSSVSLSFGESTN